MEEEKDGEEGRGGVAQEGGEPVEERSRGEKIDMQLPHRLAWTLWNNRSR